MKSSLRGRYFSTLASGRQAASRGRGELSPQLRVRLPLVAALAEGDESLVRVVQGGLAALAPPALPLAFQVVHIVARRNGPGVVVRLRVQPREVGRGQGGGGLGRAPVDEGHEVLVVKAYAVVGKVVALRQLPDVVPEAFDRRL